MKISLITVTHNSEKYLEQCILSVINQNYADIEHIVVDGNSSDGTIDIIKRYSHYISHWISETDSGMYQAINKGMKMATGDIIGLLNSDDMLASSNVISAIAHSFKENDVDSLYGDLVYVNPENSHDVLRKWTGQMYKRERFKYGWMPAHPTFYFRKELLDRLGYYETHYFTAADYEFMARYLYHNNVSSLYLPKLIVRMRNGGASNGSIYRRLRANRRDYLAMKKNQIPFPLVASVLKPIRKLPQYYRYYINKIFVKQKKSRVNPTPVNLSPAR